MIAVGLTLLLAGAFALSDPREQMWGMLAALIGTMVASIGMRNQIKSNKGDKLP
jgi:hypothetical protein